MQAPSAPLVILLDIDGTLIGDITPQVVMYELANRIKQSQHKVQPKPQLSTQELQDKLREGIVRPHFKTFMNEMHNAGVEVFIYTASEKKWAEFLVKNIELAYKVKFPRPLFTRNHCTIKNGECVKKISTVLPYVVKTLNRKYAAKFTPADFANNIMIVDNNNVYHKDDQDKMVLCGTYKYRCPENIASQFTRSSYNIYSPYIHDVMVSYLDNYKPMKSFVRFEKQFYTDYVSSITNVISQRDECMNDSLFKIITWCIVNKNLKSFTKNNIKYINWKLQHGNK